MKRLIDRVLHRALLAARHPGTALAPWRGRGLESLDAVRIECAGPARAAAPAPLMADRTFRLAARKVFPHAREAVFDGRSDPLLHEGLRGMILAARSYGLRTSVATDAVLLEEGEICALLSAGTDRLAVFSGGEPRAERNLGILAKVMRKTGAGRPVLERVPPGLPAPRGRCVDVAWDGGVYAGGALRRSPAPPPIGWIGELSPREILLAARRGSNPGS
jgi:hypothetical protein